MSQIRTDSIVPSGGVPAGATGGGTIQVVQTVKTDTFFASGNSGTQAVTGLSVSITPRSTSNKILVMVQLSAGTNNNQSGVLVYRNGSVTSYRGNVSSNRTRAATGIACAQTNELSECSIVFVDSPASTSAQTYAVYVTTDGNTSVYVNYTNLDSDSSAYLRGASSITVMEVSA